MPQQSPLLNTAVDVLRRQRPGACPEPAETPPAAALSLDPSALALACPKAHSVLTVFGHELAADTAIARNLSVNALVRIEAASLKELHLTLVNGAVRLEQLARHPNIFDGLSDLGHVWPAPLRPGDSVA